MNQTGLNPVLEQLWSEEVRYLHSLWHHGTSANPNPSNIINKSSLRASIPPSVRKENAKKKNRKKKLKGNSDPPQSSGLEWPCEPTPEPRKETGWPWPVSHSDGTARPASAEEQAKHEALQLQQKSLKASQDFFAGNLDSDGEDGDDEDEDEGGLMEHDGVEEFEFFMGIFKEDSELRSYYEKNCECGEFCCLVCGGIGKKLGKRFKNCVALVQHSVAISKTGRKKAHRAFAQVVCRVLGWDIKRLPSIVLSVGEPLGRLLAQGEAQPEVGTLKENDKVVTTGDNAGGDKKEDLSV